MKENLLLGFLFAISATGFSQTIEKEFLLREIRSSDDFEYEEYTYNSEMLLTSTDNLLIDDSIRVRDTLTYDEFNNVVKLDGYQLINNNWTHVFYMDYRYDQNGSRLTRTNYNSFGGPVFTLGGMYKYFYENDRLTNWEMYMDGTDLVEVCTITYNADGRVIEELVQDTWRTGSMQDSWKMDYEYNPDGTLLSAIPSFWDGNSWNATQGGEWFNYDDNGNCIKWEHKSGERVTNRNEYDYNMDYTVEQLVLPASPEDRVEKKSLVEMNNMVTVNRWFTENDQGVLIYICDYIYTYEPLGTMGVQNHGFAAEHIRVYPNPTSELISISSDKSIIGDINVLDNTGKLVLKESNLNKKETNLDVSNLQSGVYYIRLVTSKGIVTEKLVVQ